MIDIHWTEVDHVNTVWTDAPLPLRAGLLFRTGRMDETLVTGGQTHLIEHISLSAVSEFPHNNNGMVGGIVTGFYTLGKPQEVSNFLNSICNALRALPGDRLDSEKKVLAAESAGRHYDFHSNLLAWRYGVRGYGLFAMDEIGLRNATLEQLRAYAAQRFTRENAILLLSGPLPDDLRLPLPHGTKQPVPPLTPIQRIFPCWYKDDRCGGIAVGSIVPRSYASTIFCQIASTRLLKRLRSDQAMSYAPSVTYDPLNNDIAHLTLYADSEKAHRKELANIFSEIFNGFNDIGDAELEEARNQILEYQIGSLAPPIAERKMIEIQRAAMDWIMGSEYKSIETNVANIKAITLEDMKIFVHELQATAMFALPGEASLLPTFGKMASTSTVPAVQGHKIAHKDAPVRPERLVYSPEGVSILWPKDTAVTVRYTEIAASICYLDGGIRLIGNDSAAIMVEPTMWQDGQTICRKIRERVPAQLIIEEPARPANTIPKPSTTAWQRFRAWMNPYRNKPRSKLSHNWVITFWIYIAFMIIGMIYFVIFVLTYK